MKKHHLIFVITFAILSISLTGCKKDGGGGFNLFSLEDDKMLGAQVHAEISSDPATYPILSQSTYSASYAYLEQMKTNILNSGQVAHKDDFDWNLYIIHDDNVLNAFATPGGNMYVYTGIIKYFDDASSLAGVLGHEIAHADQRHSTEQMTKQYGIATLLQVALGENQGLLTEIAQGLVSLKFSRSDESEADEFSVVYLCPTKYHADGAANFFQKIVDSGSPTPPQFLSTHPSPDNRVADIRMSAMEKGCSATITSTEDMADYAAFVSTLP